MIWIEDIIYEILQHDIYLSITFSQLNKTFYRIIKSYPFYQLFLRHRQFIACGAYHSCIIRNKQLYVTGNFNNKKFYTPTLFQHDTLSVCCYYDKTIVITNNGSYYYHHDLIIPIPLKNVVAVSLGMYHGVLLTLNHLYDLNFNIIPFNINGVQKICCGGDFTLILKNNQVYKKNTTIHLLSLDYYIDIACGCRSSLLLNENYEVYGIGRNTNGCLGLGDCDTIDMPTKIIDNVISIYCGEYYSLFLKLDGQVYACGDNYRGQLLSYHSLYPILLPIHFDDVGCGDEHYIFRKGNKYYGVGYNRQSQLGLGQLKNKKYKKPQQLKFSN